MDNNKDYIADEKNIAKILPYVKASEENTREGYKKALDSGIPLLKINEEALKTIAEEIKKEL